MKSLGNICFITLLKNAFSSPNPIHFHLLSVETSLFCNSEGLARPMASRRTLMKSILGREGKAVAIVFIPVYNDMGKSGYNWRSVPKTSQHGSCRPLCGNRDFLELCWSGALKGAERVSCVLVGIALGLRMNLITVAGSVLCCLW